LFNIRSLLFDMMKNVSLLKYDGLAKSHFECN